MSILVTNQVNHHLTPIGFYVKCISFLKTTVHTDFLVSSTSLEIYLVIQMLEFNKIGFHKVTLMQI